jgi:uncharacterized protein with FMN-binding domain
MFKKYLQITFILGVFFILVLFLHRTQNKNVVTPDVLNVSPSKNGNSTSRGTFAFKDGTYSGSVEDAFYGSIQVEAVISNGKLTDVVPLQYPNDNPTSISINTQALPILKAEAIQNQSANVDFVTGASDSSPAFAKSLGIALSKAH